METTVGQNTKRAFSVTLDPFSRQGDYVAYLRDVLCPQLGLGLARNIAATEGACDASLIEELRACDAMVLIEQADGRWGDAAASERVASFVQRELPDLEVVRVVLQEEWGEAQGRNAYTVRVIRPGGAEAGEQ
jgi:hypothetical protein